MLIPWVDTATWNSLTAGVQRNGVEAVAAPDVASNYNGTVPATHAITVTSSVAAWAANPLSNYGWVLVTPAGLSDSWQFDSSEGALLAAAESERHLHERANTASPTPTAATACSATVRRLAPAAPACRARRACATTAWPARSIPAMKAPTPAPHTACTVSCRRRGLDTSRDAARGTSLDCDPRRFGRPVLSCPSTWMPPAT